MTEKFTAGLQHFAVPGSLLPEKSLDKTPELMMAVMDHITVYEDGRLHIKFYDKQSLK